MMRILPLLLAPLLLVACGDTRADLVGIDADGDGYGSWVDCDDDDPDVHPGQTEEPYNGVDDDCDPDTPDDDLDGDGHAEADDCDDANPHVHPDASEVCDGIDNDCDGEIDENVLGIWYADTDEDGYGDPDVSTDACDDDGGTWVANDRDCDDDDADVNPAAIEVCGNDIDDDCDGDVDDEDDDVTGPLTWYRDVDGDEYGVDSDTVVQCTQPDGYAAASGDCDDSADGGASIHPGADEDCSAVDRDCDGHPTFGATDATTWWADHDGDGFAADDDVIEACTEPEGYDAVPDPADVDCDDRDADQNPDADEVCNGEDDDCDGDVDDADDDVVGAPTWYVDADGDDFGVDGDDNLVQCEQPDGYAANADDCNDDDTLDDDDEPIGADAFPGGTEVCDQLDNDCNGTVDDVPTAPVWFFDDDGDGYGTPATSQVACDDPGDKWVDNDLDCDDTTDAVAPDEPEICNEIDDDCNGLVDDGTAADVAWYLDGDGDGQGDENATALMACSQPTPWHVDNQDDCDDTDDTIYDGAKKVCDGLDHDCDGNVDFDEDGDGFFDASEPTCLGALDCDDADTNVSPASDDCAWGRSCAEALANEPTLTTGDVLLDPDGFDTGVSPQFYHCEMGADVGGKPGAGWTRLHMADFESSAQGWRLDDDATASRTDCGDFGYILGDSNETNSGYVYMSFDETGTADREPMVPHQQIVVDYTFVQLDSWESPGDYGYLFFTDGTYQYDLWEEVLGTGDSNVCGSGGNDESYVRQVLLWNDASSVTLGIGATLELQGNEWFGLDDVEVWVR